MRFIVSRSASADSEFQWVDKIGVNCWSGVTSDNAANCNKARRLLAEYNPRILNMADACHNLHNACKDICNLPEFKDVRSIFNLLFGFNLVLI